MGTMVLLPRDLRHVEQDAPSSPSSPRTSSSSSNHALNYKLVHTTSNNASNRGASSHATYDLIQKGTEGKRPKMRTSYRVAKPPKSDDIPVFTILQRPKTSDAIDSSMISKFMVKTDCANTSGTLNNEANECSPAYCNEKEKLRRFDGPDKGHGKHSPHIIEMEMEMDGIKAKPASLDVNMEKSKSSRKVYKTMPKFCKDLLVSGGKSESGKTAFKVVEKTQQTISEGLPDSQNPLYAVGKNRSNVLRNQQMSKASSNGVVKAQQNVFWNRLVTKGNVSTLHNNAKLEQEMSSKKVEDMALPQQFVSYPRVVGVGGLRRSSTDPQSVQNLAREMISYNNEANKPESLSDSMTSDLPANIESYRCTNNELYNEKWAGPAYSSSPSPSALPLPKFTMSNVKLQVSSMKASCVPRDHRIVPIIPVEQCKSSSDVRPYVCASVAGEYDVVLATKSLRRMLNLDL